MKHRFLFLMIGLAFFSAFLNVAKAQDLKTEVYEKIHIPNKKPVPYVSTREADVMWEKTVWRMIDLRQKMNLPLYYPTKAIGSRMSLIDILLWGMKNEGLKVYATDDELNEFAKEMTYDQVSQALGGLPDTIKRTGMADTIIPGEIRNDQVKKVLVKEKWFFDKQYSTMQVRIIGLCPIRVYSRPGDSTNTPIMKKLFWVYYPDARNLLCSHDVFNPFNDAQRISFDDLFMQRRFDSYIFAESNVYNNRTINDYAPAEALQEAERIKNWIFDTEQDLWEY